MDSILNSVKKMLGIEPDYTHFDSDITMHINAVFMILTQMGVGPVNGFVIYDSKAVWTDFVPDQIKVESIKTYVFLKVKLIFDPPLNSAVLEAMNRMISELEWRLNINHDIVDKEDEPNVQ